MKIIHEYCTIFSLRLKLQFKRKNIRKLKFMVLRLIYRDINSAFEFDNLTDERS